MAKIAIMARNLSVASGLCFLLVTFFSARALAQIDMQQAVASSLAGKAGQMSPRSKSEVTSAGLQGPLMVPPHFADLRLAQGFLLSLNVLDDPDFTGAFRVDEAGNIALPELGSIHVLGKTVPEAREEIANGLVARGILKEPQVELNVLEYIAPQVTILGAVATPGVFPLLAPEGLGDVLALAGDTTILAGDRIEVTSSKSGGKAQLVPYSRGMDTKQLDNIIVQPGDTVRVNHAGIIYVLGGVSRPGGYVMQENGKLSALQAISIAGGTGITASIKSIYVMRRNKDNTVAWLRLPYKKMTEGKVADVQLRTNDVLFVPTSRIKSTLMSSQAILAGMASASIYAGVLY